MKLSRNEDKTSPFLGISLLEIHWMTWLPKSHAASQVVYAEFQGLVRVLMGSTSAKQQVK
jgi:hypothetical protein